MSDLTPVERVFLLLCVISALLAIVIGYALPSTGANILKDFLVFGSGAGIAYVLARASARAFANERVRSLNKRSKQRLGLIAFQARSAAARLPQQPGGPYEPIAANFENLALEAEVTMADLEEGAGTKLDLDAIVADALNSISDAAVQALPSGSHEVKEKLLSAIREPLKTFEQQLKDASAAPRGLSPIDVGCSQCGNQIRMILSAAPGSTVHAVCPKCKARLIVNRGARGIVVSSLPRSPMLCPNCQKEIIVTIKPGDPKFIVRNCFGCDQRIYVDTEKGVIDHSEKGEPLSCTYTIQGDKAIFSCPACMNEIRVRPNPAYEFVKASCSRCTSLIYARPEPSQTAVEHTASEA